MDVFDEGVIASALAVDYCDGTVYGLVDDGARYVVAMADEGDTQELPADSVAMEAYAIACGDFEKGALAVLTDSEVVFFNSSLVETGRDSVSAVAIAAGDAEVLGLDQALVCSSEGCDLAAGDVDGDGVDEVLVVQTSGSTLRLGAETFELPGGTHAGMLELER